MFDPSIDKDSLVSHHEVSKLLTTARQALGEDDLDLAEKSAQSVLDHLPNEATALQISGETAFARGEIQKANDAFLKVLSVLPGSIDALLGIALCARAQGYQDRELAALTEAVSLQPEDFALVSQLRQRLSWSESTQPISLVSIAKLGMRFSLFDQVAALLEANGGPDEDDPNCRHIYIEALWRAGRAKEARRVAKEAISQGSGAILPRAILGALCADEHDIDGARWWWQELSSNDADLSVTTAFLPDYASLIYALVWGEGRSPLGEELPQPVEVLDEHEKSFEVASVPEESVLEPQLLLPTDTTEETTEAVVLFPGTPVVESDAFDVATETPAIAARELLADELPETNGPLRPDFSFLSSSDPEAVDSWGISLTGDDPAGASAAETSDADGLLLPWGAVQNVESYADDGSPNADRADTQMPDPLPVEIPPSASPAQEGEETSARENLAVSWGEPLPVEEAPAPTEALVAEAPGASALEEPPPSDAAPAAITLPPVATGPVATTDLAEEVPAEASAPPEAVAPATEDVLTTARRARERGDYRAAWHAYLAALRGQE